jgi:UDP-GlcNAc:undecaprenyl-phosphate GlcNAc-1-phosphate transferase
MTSLLLLGLTSFLVALVLTPLCRDVFLAIGVVDRPDGKRKVHKKPVARMGGVAVGFAYVSAFVVLWASPLRSSLLATVDLPPILRLAPAALVIFITGFLDDLLNLRPVQKLCGQFLAAGLAFWAGVRILAVDGYSTTNWWSLPLTILWLVACTNAFNFIDGIDGLAAGLGFFATVTILLAALLQNNIYLALACIPLAGALLGFLFFNFHPASIFLGDSGSLLIGFLLGCYGVIWTQKSATLLAMLAPVMTLSVPILDMCLSVVRRMIRSKPIFGADRGHIHHQLLDRGLGPRGVVLVLYAFTLLGAGFSLLESVFLGYYTRIIILIFCVLACFGIRSLHYIEFNVARRVLFKGEFLKLVHANLFLKTFEQTLRNARTIPEWRRIVENACRELGFNRVEIGIGGQISEVVLPCGTQGEYCLSIPLTGPDFINLTRDFFCPVHPTILSSFIDLLRTYPPASVEYNGDGKAAAAHSVKATAAVIASQSRRESSRSLGFGPAESPLTPEQ